jgi:hypothetical protein
MAADQEICLSAGKPTPGETQTLHRFLQQSARPWHHEPVRLTDRLVRALWSLIVVNIVTGFWMYLLASGKVPRANIFSSVSSFGGHEVLLGATSLGCATVLLILAPFTGGLRWAGTSSLVLLTCVCLLSVVAASGIIAALLMIISIVGTLIALIVAVAGTA